MKTLTIEQHEGVIDTLYNRITTMQDNKSESRLITDSLKPILDCVILLARDAEIQHITEIFQQLISLSKANGQLTTQQLTEIAKNFYHINTTND